MHLQLSPLRVPGTDLKVCTESKGHGEVIPSRSWSELPTVHTFLILYSHLPCGLYIGGWARQRSPRSMTRELVLGHSKTKVADGIR